MGVGEGKARQGKTGRVSAWYVHESRKEEKEGK